MKLRLTALLLLTFIVSLCNSLSASKQSTALSQDYNSGAIGLAERILYRVYAVTDPDLLPQKYKSDSERPGKSGTGAILEVWQNLDLLDVTEREAIRDALSRPTLTDTYDSPAGYYKIHFNTSGENAVSLDDLDPANGVPDFVERVAVYADSAYKCLHLHLGYPVPPVDDSAGGDNRYDIYLMDIPYYGYTAPEIEGPNPWNDYVTYMVMDNDYDGFPPNDDPEGDAQGAARVTAVHEYFHATQFGLNYMTAIWYMEVSSAWIEEICFPLVNDNYAYLEDFFDYPQLPLDSVQDFRHYGAFVFNRFLDSNYDTVLVRNVWEDLRYEDDIYIVLDSVLVDYGSSLSGAYAEFALWNWMTGFRDDGNHYEDGADYPLVDLTGEVNFYPTGEVGPPPGYKPWGLGANYLKFNPAGGLLGDLVVRFDGVDSLEFGAGYVVSEPGGVYHFDQIELNSAQAGSLIVHDFDLKNYVMLNPAVKSWQADSASYNFSASFLPFPEYASEISGDGPAEIYSSGSRRVYFWVKNVGQENSLYRMSATADSGWQFSFPDSVYPLFVRDSVYVAVDVTAAGGLVSGSEWDITLNAVPLEADTILNSGSLRMNIVVHNGDANNDGNVDVSDAVYIINFAFVAGFPEPVPEYDAGDANCDGIVDVSDAVFIINYAFVPGSPEPPCWVY
ncbi:MAG: hypothetical protein GF404_10165 [candidate division Zixibacteria bacterium]|nr:hypothetical protein [candidate division Zixibacteria bacterium]